VRFFLFLGQIDNKKMNQIKNVLKSLTGKNNEGAKYNILREPVFLVL